MYNVHATFFKELSQMHSMIFVYSFTVTA